MVQLEFDFNEREKQTGVDWLVKELTRQNMYMHLFTKEIEQAQEVEYKRIREAIMYALDEDGHTGDWKIKFANDYINNLKQTK
jgi:hypothetical protein